MTFEVEQKFPVADLDEIQQRLLGLGARIGETIDQSDRYYAHPCRDFARTDEALRIRRVGPHSWITFKGPKIDALTKTRREIELPLEGGEDQACRWDELLQSLGFQPVAEVRKRRRTCHLLWQGAQTEIALDDVAGVGQYVELELIAEDESLDAARRCILSLAEQLQLSAVERRSYLELLLSGDRGA